MIFARTVLSMLAALLLVAVPSVVGAQAKPQQAEAAPQQQILVLLRLPSQHYRPNAAYGGGYGDDPLRTTRRRLATRVARDHGLQLVGNWPMPLLGLDCFIMAVPEGRSTADATAQVSRDAGVAWAEPVQSYRALGASSSDNDPLFAAQPAARLWRLGELHEVATGRGTTIAVIDSRIEAAHPDLAGQVPVSEDFVGDHVAVGEQHGTGVAGVIAAKAGNALGIAGVAPNARLMGLRACWQTAGPSTPPTLCNSLSLAKALHFAIEHNAQIINLSLSGPEDLLLGRLLEIARARRIAVVAAFDPDLPKGGFPASHPGVIAVSDGSIATLPAGVYIAPGRDVPTTQPGGRWFLVNGSSYAAAHVSGLIALVRERRTFAGSPFALAAAGSGGGVIDACATLLHLTQRCDCSCALARQLAANGNR